MFRGGENILVKEDTTNARILLVKDEAIFAHDIKQRLKRLGYQVVGIADTGAEAMKLATDTKPNLILMDISIRGPLDGIGTAAEIAGHADVPIVLLTGHSDSTTFGRAKHVGPYGHVLIPCEDREPQTSIEMAIHRHRSEAKARLLFEAMSISSDGIAIADVVNDEWRFAMCNPAFERLTGYSSLELRSLGLDILEGPETESAEMECLRLAVKQGQECQTTFLAHRKDGGSVWNELKLSIVRDLHGQVSHLLLSCRDVTKRKETELARRQLRGRGSPPKSCRARTLVD